MQEMVNSACDAPGTWITGRSIVAKRHNQGFPKIPTPPSFPYWSQIQTSGAMRRLIGRLFYLVIHHDSDVAIWNTLCNQNSIQQFVEEGAVFSWLNRDFSLLMFCLHPDKWKEPEARVHVNPTSELSQGDNGTMGGVIYQILPRSAMITIFVQSHANIHMNRTVFTGPDIP